MNTKKLTTMAMLCAMAFTMSMLIRFPLVPGASFLTYDPKDIILVIGGFIYGPLTAFFMSGICAILDIAFRGGNLIDVLMNMISTCSFCCLAAYIYKRNHTKKGAMLSLVSGIVCVTIVMTVWNYIITPIYMGVPRSVVLGMLLPGIIPFNLIKYGLNAGGALFLYKPLVNALRNSRLVEASSNSSGASKGLAIIGLFIIITLGVFIMSLQGMI